MRHGNLYIARVEYLDSGTVHQSGANLVHRDGDAAKTDPAPYMLKRSQFKWEREIRLLSVPRRFGRRQRQAPAAQVGLVESCQPGRTRSTLRHRSAGQMERELTGPGFTYAVEESDLCRRILVQLRLPGLP